MIRNYLKVSFRNLKRNTSYMVLNVLGLALGIACSVLIFSLVKYHLSFDNFHTDSDRIYRIVTEMHREQVSYSRSVPNPLGKAYREDYDFVEKAARIATFEEELITLDEHGEQKKFKDDVAFVEQEFFEIFNYPLVQGNHQTALKELNTAIVTEDIAKKYFGAEDPINKTFRLENKIEFKITGVLKNLPENTERQTGIYLSYNTVKDFDDWFYRDDSWGGTTSAMQCFVKLKPNISVTEAEAVFPAYVTKFRPTSKNVHHYHLQPLSDIHFSAVYDGAMSMRNLWVLSFIGIFLIITACVNFINLATAQALNRSKEVGVRKSLGGRRFQFFWQFITETGLITVLATAVALVLAYVALPYVNQWFDSRVSIHLFSDWQLITFIAAMIFAVTFFSGSYPGLILSGFQPAFALKGKLSQQKVGGFNTRRTLIIAQFTISQVLMIGLIVVIYQLKYARQSDLGFKKDAIVMLPLGSEDEKLKTLKNQLSQIAGVEHVSICGVAPSSDSNWNTSLFYDNATEEETFSGTYRGADENYLATFDLTLVAGRNLLPSDSVREFLINETLAKKLNVQRPEDIIGKTLAANGGNWHGPIVGVVKDFHDQSFHQEIKPIFMTTARYESMAVRLNSADFNNTLASIEKTWSTMYPDKIYEHQFVDDQIAEFYKTEDTMLKLIQAFSFIAIFIGCMGLYGLVSFMALQKTKEIGIRKVLGSGIANILWIFGREFALLIIGAFALAAPLGWWLMNTWLQDFEYKIPLSPWIFVLAIGTTTVIALITVSYQSLSAALMNPVKALKTE